MPPPRIARFLRRKLPDSHGAPSLLRYLFPHTRQRARAHLSKFRHETLPSFRHYTQSRIYKYILYKQAQKLKTQPGVLQRLRGHTRKLFGTGHSENVAWRRGTRLTAQGDKDTAKAMSYYGEQRESGARRKKLAGYLKAANELRQTYAQQYAPGWSRREATYDYEDDTPGGFPDAAVVRNGDEEMILFPSYARKHIRRKPQAEPGTIQETPGDGRDVRDSTGAGDAEFWKQQWDAYEDDNAVVDVDVRGWIYSPHKGPMSRKQRIFISLARQLVGVQAPASASNSQSSSRDPSPSHLTHRDRAQVRQAQRDELLTAKEADEILRRGEKEAEVAAQGGYSEKPKSEADDFDTLSLRSKSAESIRPDLRTRAHQISEAEEPRTGIQKRASWNQPANMSQAELAEANARLLARLRHFLAIPMANTPISVFFYNDEVSKQRTVYTDASGHFSISAALDFVPTHVRILASDHLSATEDIHITEQHGVSVISDIDDTIKHSAISSGAREIFRNAFIRDLGDLTIEGVKDWYNSMAAMGVKFHYVSNSPWQLFPVIQKYFSMAGLPPGSFHLKQYSGMLQGIFEPVAERKKSTLDKIARDFPERSFILVGDSGEADLEVYTDFVLENPGRVIAVFIRDVTTPEGSGFFDPSVGSMGGDRTSSFQRGRGSGSSANGSASTANRLEEDDPELRAAIQASIRDMEEADKRRSKSTFPTIDEDHPEHRPSLPPRAATRSVENLIDLDSDDEPSSSPTLRRVNTDTQAETSASTPRTHGKAAPPPPRKPVALRSTSGESVSSSSTPNKAPPPPKPRRPSSSIHQASPLSNEISPTASRPQPGLKPGPKPTPSSQQTYAGIARDKLSSVYNGLPALRSQEEQYPTLNASTSRSTNVTVEESSEKKPPPPPPPPRRGITAYPVQAASYVGGKAASAWQNAPAIPHPSTRPNASLSQSAHPYSTTASGQYPQRTSTGSTLGQNGNGNGDYGQGMDKRVVLWRQRWSRAEGILREKGVVLKSWRVGTDVMKEAERLVKQAVEREKKENREAEREEKGRNGQRS
ncbi:hypothetical protein BDV96DRAFT_572237 [Lophiotrema nucula]|uniref:Phosphatidate phosphatase APP1 catalytic domain-containing protein n=1 Tax=Lophiotrema nucula TaxID=690887 RepID=A0A6A5ZC56_9PLEO|nr:hypothetical protein BDV96DRAFT_572237 [Lophiotrema nucula]